MDKQDIQKGKYTCVSLFSGLLGLDLGLHEAGFATKLALDFDKDSRDVVNHNFPDLPFVHDDIRNVTADEIRKHVGDGEIDLLAGGPPCQPFSKSGLRKGLTDKRGNLFEHYIRVLLELKPRAFILENVRGILSSRKGKDWEEIVEGFNETGYTIYWKLIDAANYGVPQFRQRLFLIGFRDQVKFKFPEATHDEDTFVTVRDALQGLEEPGDYTDYNGKYSHLLDDIPPGMNYSFYCAERGHPNPLFEWRSKFWYFLLKADPDKPSLTIQAQPGNNTGPFHWQSRRYGLNELKRLQTLPDWFCFNDKGYMTAHKLIGNAVPSRLASVIGRAIAETLENWEPVEEQQYNYLLKKHASKSISSGNGSGKKRKSRKSKNQSTLEPHIK